MTSLTSPDCFCRNFAFEQYFVCSCTRLIMFASNKSCMCFWAGSSRWYSNCFGGDAMYGFWLYLSCSLIGSMLAGSHILFEKAWSKSVNIWFFIVSNCVCRSCLYVFDVMGMLSQVRGGGRGGVYPN